MHNFLRALLNSQFWLSDAFDKIFPRKYQIDGHDDFRDNILPSYVMRDMLIYDVGGGKRPYIDSRLRTDRNLKVIGLDIDLEELERAPEGAYESTICADIRQYRGRNDADLVICQATLEHVPDTEKAFASLATIPKRGGRIALFVPSRNAVFARLNLMLPERLKRFLLQSLFGHTVAAEGGFKAYYDKCTPRQFARMARQQGFEIELEKLYFSSGYFSFFVPAHILWRLWILGFHALAGKQAAETFVMVLRLVNPPDDRRSPNGGTIAPEHAAVAEPHCGSGRA
jgi:SAM-dependent methyltransferase